MTINFNMTVFDTHFYLNYEGMVSPQFAGDIRTIN